MNNSSKYISTNPEKMVFNKQSDSKYVARVILSNLTSNYIIFKVYMNKDQIYSANPAFGFIDPSGTTQLVIKRVANDNFDIDQPCSDKFLIKAYISNKAVTDNSEVRGLLSNEDLRGAMTQTVTLAGEYNRDLLVRSFTQRNNQEEPQLNFENRSQSTNNLDESRNGNLNFNVSNMDIRESFDELTKKINEIKNQIKDCDYENEKLTNQIKNFSLNMKANNKKNSVLGEKEQTKTKSTLPFSFVVFAFTIGLIFGAYLNKLF